MRGQTDTRSRDLQACAHRRETEKERERERERESFLENHGKFEARCASESVLRIPGQSSGCALTARNPAAFSPSLATGAASVTRQRATRLQRASMGPRWKSASLPQSRETCLIRSSS